MIKEGKMVYRIGTRGSRLALAQAEYVRSRLNERFPEHGFELAVVKTTGDVHSETPMRQVGTKGMFIKELEEHLLAGTIDMAVHSMKDMPARLPEGLALAKAWEREDPRDALILREKGSLDELPYRAVIATGSLRRKYQLLRIRPDLKVIDIRGNVETRIRKMQEWNLDGIILAAAGLKRLNLEEKITQYFDYDQMIPAPAQGALAIETAENRKDVLALLTSFEDEETSRILEAERRFLELMDAGCHQPVGAIGEMEAGEIRLRAVYTDEAGQALVFADVRGREAALVAEMAADRCKEKK